MIIPIRRNGKWCGKRHADENRHVLRSDLEPWQRLNVAAFTISGVASRDGAVGEDYQVASGKRCLPMFKEPVLVIGANADEIARTVDRARSRDVEFSIFTQDLFNTFNDVDNRAAVAADTLYIIRMAFRTTAGALTGF